MIQSIAMVLSMAMLFLSCKDTYERVGEEAIKTIYPRGIAENFVLTYSETVESLETEDIKSSKVIAVLTSPINYNYDNLSFSHQTFPKGLQVDLFDGEGKKTVIVADYGIKYTLTNLIDLQGNVVIEGHDGKRLETQQLFFDEKNEWIFSQGKFTFTDPEDGTIMDGEGMDVMRDLSALNAHKTYGLTMIKERLND